jgi:hypothetical protein
MRGKNYFSCDLLSLDYFTIALREKKFSGLRNNSKSFPHTYKLIKLRKKEKKAKKCINFQSEQCIFLPVLID